MTPGGGTRDGAGRITVLRVIDRLNVGGPALHVVLAAARLDPRRFRTVLVHGDVEAGEGDMGYLLEQHGVTAIHLPGLSRELRPLRDLRALLQLLQLMWHERPDVVHTHKSKAGLLGRLAATIAAVPVRIHTYHGHVLTGYFGQGRALGLVWMERALALVSTRLVTLSQQLRTELSIEQRVAGADRFRVVPLGLDLAPFRCIGTDIDDDDGDDIRRGALRRELGLTTADRLIGVVGRMVSIKDHGSFLAAFDRLCQQRADVHAVLVGGGDREPALRAEVARRGLLRRVSFLGWRRDLPAIYADLDLLALTSLNEGTPVAVIEALAAGVPVVATAVGGVPDVLRGGRRGRLVPPGDEVALWRALGEVLDDPAALGRARDGAARDEVCAEYGIDRLCTDLAGLYEAELAAAATQGPALSVPVAPAWTPMPTRLPLSFGGQVK